MIKRHSVRNGAGTLQRMVAPVQGDAEREIRNGFEPIPYLPADPGRRERLLQALEQARNNDAKGSVTEDNDYMREGTDA